MEKQVLKQEITRLKSMLKTTTDYDLLHKSLEIIYERISNRKDESYSNKYDIVDIFKGRTVKTIKKHKKGTGVVFEIIEYDKIPKGFVIIYNQFEGHAQNKIDMYIMK